MDPTERIKPIETVLAHSNPLVLTAMSEHFDRDPRFSLVATTSTTEGFLGVALRLPIQIGVIDWNLPALGGAKLIEVVREQEKGPRMIVYGDETSDLPRLAMSTGAAGFAARSAEPESILRTCAEVAQGKMVFPFIDIRELQRDPIHSLSKKERAILEALSKGLTNRQLASEFDISPNTVKFHLSNLYDKLSVKNRAQAIAFYYSARLSDDG